MNDVGCGMRSILRGEAQCGLIEYGRGRSRWQVCFEELSDGKAVRGKPGEVGGRCIDTTRDLVYYELRYFREYLLFPNPTGDISSKAQVEERSITRVRHS